MKLSKYNFKVNINEKDFVLLNTLSNEFAVIKKDVFNELQKNCDTYIDLHPEYFKQLFECGFIVDDDCDEEVKVRDLFLSKCYNSSIFTVTIIPATLCNLACDYCFVEDTQKIMNSDVKKQTIYFIKKRIKEMSPFLKCFNIQWFGGEPLLAIDIIKDISEEIITLCDTLGIKYYAKVFTNLTLLDSYSCDILKSSRIIEINTTLDGYGEFNDKRRHSKNGKSYFDSIINNIKLLKEDFHVNIQVNIDKTNQSNIPVLLDYLVNNGVLGQKVSVGFNLINDNDNIKNKDILYNYSDKVSMDLVDEYQKQLGEFAHYRLPHSTLSCLALAKNSFVIDPEGNLYKCYKETKYNKRYGTIYGDTKYTDEKYFNILYDPFERKDCIECNVFPLCFGGCFSERNNKLICSYKYTLERKIKRYFNNAY